MYRAVFFTAAVVLSLAIVACSSNSASGSGKTVTSSSSDDPIATMRQNLDAAANEDLDAYMATLDPRGPLYNATETMMREVFANYDLKYELTDIKVVEKTDSEVKVQATQVTRKVRGPAFRDNKLVAVHTLRRTNGVWLLYDSEIKSIEYLD